MTESKHRGGGHPDSEIEALLHFTPVVRKCVRGDGWPADKQRGFVAALASSGNVARAAQAVGRTESGAYKVRTSAGAESFAAAWDKAVALHDSRNPRIERRGRPPRGVRQGWDEGDEPDFEDPDPEEEERLKLEVFNRMIEKYLRKLHQERAARLEGRIVEADFCVRQLTFIEVMLDLGLRGMRSRDVFRVLDGLAPGNLMTVSVVATPLSVYLDKVRRAYWAEKGEPDRAALASLGDHDDTLSFGEPNHYYTERDGDYKQWLARQEQKHALAAEAQAAWEEKARADAEAWAKRVEEEGGGPTGEKAK